MTTQETITEALNLNGCRFHDIFVDSNEIIVVECKTMNDSAQCARALQNADILDKEIWVNSQYVEIAPITETL